MRRQALDLAENDSDRITGLYHLGTGLVGLSTVTTNETNGKEGIRLTQEVADMTDNYNYQNRVAGLKYLSEFIKEHNLSRATKTR